MNRIVIVGGGIAGLSAAYYATKNIPAARITLIESSNHWGGKITTDRATFNGGQFIIEGGPDTFLATNLMLWRYAKNLISAIDCMLPIPIRKTHMS
jgi:oxygen-dependent protoporphyrinogen oxidase